MKRFLSLALALVFVLASFTFVACNSTETTPTPTGDEAKPVLKVGMECAYDPFNFTQLDDSNGAIKIANAGGYANGYDVMIAKKIADSLGMTLEIYKYEWDALIPAVQAGTLDFIIAGMSPTAERLEEIDFSAAYYESQLVLVVRKDGAYASATSLSEMSGAKIVAQVGTFHNDALQAQAATFGMIPQTPMESFPAMINALNTKAIDGYVAEEPGAKSDCEANADFTYIPLKNNDTGFTASAADVQIAVGLKKGSELKAKVDQALAAISAEERLSIMETATQYAVANKG